MTESSQTAFLECDEPYTGNSEYKDDGSNTNLNTTYKIQWTRNQIYNYIFHLFSSQPLIETIILFNDN